MLSPFLKSAVEQEAVRQQQTLQLIASENDVSVAVRELQGSVLTNKYAEGYPGKRYYAGCEIMDDVEQYAIDRACELFGARYANVQPHSGSQANQAVLLALLQPGDTILGMDLSAGGHLTHGHRMNLSGKWFDCVSYGVNAEGLLDMQEVRQRALEHRPKLMIAGASAYAQHIDWAAFRAIAEEVGAYLLADMAHYAGLIAAGLYPSPMQHAHVVTSTTHKGLRGPRGGLIVSNDVELGKKLNSAIFPGLQGGPLMHVIAAKGQAFWEALQPEFKVYQSQVLANMKALQEALALEGFPCVGGYTQSHMALIDLRHAQLSGAQVEKALSEVGVICNKNSVPHDPLPAMQTSGIRLGSNAVTTRGLGVDDCAILGHLMGKVMRSLSAQGDKYDHRLRVEAGVESASQALGAWVKSTTQKYPLFR